MFDALLGFLSYDPIVHIKLGPLSISPHGLGIALGYLLGSQVMLPAAKRRGITEEQVYSILTRAAVGAILGARIAYVLNHPKGYLDDPIAVFKIWEGGISLLGGIAGAVLLGATRMRSYGLSFWRVMDAAVPGLAFGIIIGRIGDLVIADHLGKRTSFFLGYVCPEAETGSPCMAPVGHAVHQPALYDLISVILLFVVLLLVRRRPSYDGFLTLFFATWYGFGRLTEDFFRIDETHGTGLTGSQWTAVAVIVLSLGWLLLRRRTPWTSGRAEHESRPGDPPHGFDVRARLTEPPDADDRAEHADT